MGSSDRLTRRQEAFCRAWFETVGNQRQAYLAAGYRPTNDNSADAGASRLIRHAKVAKRIEDIAAMVKQRAADVTADSLIDELEQARLVALETKQASAMASATMGKARITGHVVDRKEVGKPGDFESMSEQELRDYIAKRLGQTNETAKDKPSDSQASDGAIDSDVGVAPLPSPTHGGSNTPQ